MKSNYFVKQIIGTLIFFSLIFISAGKLNYPPGLIYLSIGLIMLVLSYTVFGLDPDLLAERSKPGKGTKDWDKKILGISFLVTLAMFITAGLDSGRFDLSPSFHWSFTLIGIVETVVGQLLFLIAQKQNKFFSSTVRIQTNRNHQVYDKGLYRIVRHPAYLGSVIQSLGFPLLFGSLWSVIPVAASILLLVTRTYLEDKTLKKELTGYSAYAKKTKYRLIPLIW